MLWVELEIGVIGRGIKENESQCKFHSFNIKRRIYLSIMTLQKFPRWGSLATRPEDEVFVVT